MKIVQLLPSFFYGDAVGNDTLALAKAIKGMGHKTAIYADSIDKRLKRQASPLSELPKLGREDVLIYHFSTGSPVMKEAIAAQSCRKIMVYHNITPAEFFEDYDERSAENVKAGREELQAFKDEFELCLAVSGYNKRELLEAGYACPIVVLPILMDFKDYEQPPSERVLSTYGDGCTTILFVGRLAPNKKQEDIIRAFAYYHQHMEANSRLILVGNPAMAAYDSKLRAYAEMLGIGDKVVFAGHIPFRDILAFYHLADIFLCLSEHEGFCVPLLEAMYFHVPILAYAAAAVPETLGEGAALLTSKHPQHVARCMDRILHSKGTAERLVACQDRQLARFATTAVEERFRRCLHLFLRHGDLSGMAGDWETVSPVTSESFFESAAGLVQADREPGLPEFAEVPAETPLKVTGIKAKFKYRFLKPIYKKIVRRSPALANAVRNGLYDAAYLLKPASMNLQEWPHREPHILVETTLISDFDAQTGIQRVVNNICQGLCRLQPRTMAVRVDKGQFRTSRAYLRRLGVPQGEGQEQKMSVIPGDVVFLLDSSWADFSRLRKLVRRAHKQGCPAYTVIHDLFPVQYPELSHTALFVTIFRKWLAFVLSDVDGIICNSKTTADVVASYCREHGLRRSRPLQLHYMPMGFDLRESHGPVRPGLSAFVAQRPTFLMVGTVSPRKGHLVALRALEKLLAEGQDVQLLIIGKNGWSSREFMDFLGRDARLEEHVLWLLDASDAELQWAYKHTAAMIAASRDEGFGLPLIEAAYFGLPVIASDIPIFHEVTGDRADFFRAMDAESLSKTWAAWLQTDAHPDTGRIRLYTWQEASQAVLDILEGRREPYLTL